MTDFGYYIFLITSELLFYLATSYYACKIFSITIMWHFGIFSMFTLMFLIAEIVYVHDLIVYENNYYEQANLICHVLNIFFIFFYGCHVKKVLKRQREQCINLLG
jgi:hypothetical protein